METSVFWVCLIGFLIANCTDGRSALRFSGRSMISQDRRNALLKLVQSGEIDNNDRRIMPQHPIATNLIRSDSTSAEVDGEMEEGCMKKVVMVEEVEFDTEIKCSHVFQESCFESYTTSFKKTKAEECDESFKKECEIEYFKVPKEEKVEICNEMLTRDCEADGDLVCSKEYETVCETKYEEHQVTEQVPKCETNLVEKCMEDDMGQEWCDNVPQRKCSLETKTNVKLTPKTECRKEVAEVCGPESCPLVKGDRICKDEIKTVVHEVPQESCTMVPRKICNLVSKVVPTLEPVKHCINIPKEVCAKSRINPVRRKKPVVRKWCTNDPTSPTGPVDLPDRAIYSLSYSDSTTATAAILDLETGERVCTKDIDLDDSDDLFFTLIGDQRNLLSCGDADEGKCAILDLEAGTRNVVVNGPEAINAANSVNGERFFVIGGEDENGDRTDQVYYGPITGSTDVAFAKMQFKMFFADLDWQVGRGCLASFSAPDFTTVHFYATSDSDQGGLRLLLRWETSPQDGVVTIKTQKDGVLGSRPLCGHAVNSDGTTSVYFARKDSSGNYEFRSLEVPTDDVAAMNALFDSKIMPEDSEVEQGELSDGPLFVDENDFQGYSVASALPDGRSLVLLEDGRSAIYSSGKFQDGPFTNTDQTKWLFATEAEPQDLTNLGCS